MSTEIVVPLMLGSFLVLTVLGIPIAFSTGILALVFGYALQGNSIFTLVLMRFWDLMQSNSLVAIPLYIFMATMLQKSGIADELYDAIYHWMGPLRGGLAAASVAVCTILAATVGTAGAGVVIMGMMALPFMLRHGYTKRLACGSIIAGGSLGQLIPPSLNFILYGFFAGVSVGKLFIGGVIPGLVLSAMIIGYILIRCLVNKKVGPAPPEAVWRIPWRQRIGYLKTLWRPILLIVLVLGSIYGGIATPTEAAGVGAVGAILVVASHRRLTWKALKESLFTTIISVGLIMWISFGAYTFVGVVLGAGGGGLIRDIFLGFEIGRWGIIILMQLILFILGMIMDPMGIIVLCVPIFLPIIKALNFNPLWFGVLFNLNMLTGYLTPPFGLSLFYLKGVVPPDVSMRDIIQGTLPFVVIYLFTIALIMIFPQLAIWLPGTMSGR